MKRSIEGAPREQENNKRAGKSIQAPRGSSLLLAVYYRVIE